MAALRPEGDKRSFGEVAKDMKLTGAASPQQAGDFTVFRHDVTVDGNRTQAAVFFHDRVMYQLMVTTPTKALTPETYLGSDRAPASSFESPSGYQQGTGTYAFPSGSLGLNDYAFKGDFSVAAQSITAENGPASIKLHYEGSHVYLNVGGTGTLTVTDSDCNTILGRSVNVRMID